MNSDLQEVPCRRIAPPARSTTVRIRASLGTTPLPHDLNARGDLPPVHPRPSPERAGGAGPHSARSGGARPRLQARRIGGLDTAGERSGSETLPRGAEALPDPGPAGSRLHPGRGALFRRLARNAARLARRARGNRGCRRRHHHPRRAAARKLRRAGLGAHGEHPHPRDARGRSGAGEGGAEPEPHLPRADPERGRAHHRPAALHGRRPGARIAPDPTPGAARG